MKKFNTIKTTLDNKHNEIIKSFKHNEEVVIPKYLKQIEKLELMLNKSKNKLELLDTITKYKNIIKSLKTKEKNYYLNNSKYIFDYFENKKNISANDTLENSDKNNIVKQFFSLNISDESNNLIASETSNTKIKDENFIKTNNHNFIDKYFNNIDSKYLNYDKFIYPSDICNVCK